MKTKDLIADMAIHRRLSKDPLSKAQENHRREFERLAGLVAQRLSDDYDRKQRAIDRKCDRIRARLAPTALAA